MPVLAHVLRRPGSLCFCSPESPEPPNEFSWRVHMERPREEAHGAGAALRLQGKTVRPRHLTIQAEPPGDASPALSACNYTEAASNTSRRPAQLSPITHRTVRDNKMIVILSQATKFGWLSDAPVDKQSRDSLFLKA